MNNLLKALEILNISFNLSNLIYRSNITMYNDDDCNKVIIAAKNGENALLEVISSGISINVQNKVNHKILFIIP
jgi:hypothetical protein